MGKKDRKIPVSDFISDKKLEKIRAIIEKSDDTELAYDRIEELLDDDFKVKDLGTNRMVLVSRKNKYDDLIFKVAGDKHGIEANYREFYNGDLDKRLTFSYSISKNGVFIVQEKVKPFTSAILEERKKDVREMLKHLSSKILLVDCKVKNFKNFGLRKNGEVCLLDHGDTVPLPEYQSEKIVNADEESYVSLRCKGLKDPSSPKIKACGGRLKYSKNFDYLECEKCGRVLSVNDAYKEFYGDTRIGESKGTDMELSDEYYEWKSRIQEYCINTMSEIEEDNKNNNKFTEEEAMEKTINGEKCYGIKGYWIPESLTKGVFALQFQVIKQSGNPKDLLIAGGKNPNEYKVSDKEKTAHIPDGERDKAHSKTQSYVDKIMSYIHTTGTAIKQSDRTYKVPFKAVGIPVERETNGDFFRPIWKALRANPEISNAKYDMEAKRFVITLREVLPEKTAEKKAPMNEVIRSTKKNAPTSQYIVNNIVCVKMEDYYVPYELTNGEFMDHDTAKEALKAEGYQPKKFKIDEAFARPVNAGGSFVSDESNNEPISTSQKLNANSRDNIEEDPTNPLDLLINDDSDDDSDVINTKLTRTNPIMVEDLDDNDINEAEKVMDELIEATSDDSELTENSRVTIHPRKYSQQVEDYMHTSNLSDKYVAEIKLNNSIYDEIKEYSSYDHTTGTKKHRTVDLFNKLMGYVNSEEYPVLRDYKHMFASCVLERLFDLDVSFEGHEGEFVVVTDKKLIKDQMYLTSMVTLYSMLEKEPEGVDTSLITRTILDLFKPSNFDASKTPYTQEVYEMLDEFQEFLMYANDINESKEDSDDYNNIPDEARATFNALIIVFNNICNIVKNTILDSEINGLTIQYTNKDDNGCNNAIVDFQYQMLVNCVTEAIEAIAISRPHLDIAMVNKLINVFDLEYNFTCDNLFDMVEEIISSENDDHKETTKNISNVDEDSDNSTDDIYTLEDAKKDLIKLRDNYLAGICAITSIAQALRIELPDLKNK